MSLSTFTWRLEVSQHGRTDWVPYDRKAFGELDRPHLGEHTDEECWEDPVQFAQRAFDDALNEMVADQQVLRLRSARILLWISDTSRGDPAVLLQATDDQLATAQLSVAVQGVRAALADLDRARERLRNQIVAASTIDYLSRNHIARIADGAWSRRLVLQFLSGHDLARTIQRALPSDWPTYSPYLEDDGYQEIGTEHLGPYWRGPVRIDLDANGDVHVALVNPSVGVPTPDQPGEQQFDAEQIRTHARTALSALHSAGLHVSTPDGREATIDDLAATSTENRPLKVHHMLPVNPVNDW